MCNCKDTREEVGRKERLVTWPVALVASVFIYCSTLLVKPIIDFVFLLIVN